MMTFFACILKGKYIFERERERLQTNDILTFHLKVLTCVDILNIVVVIVVGFR